MATSIRCFIINAQAYMQNLNTPDGRNRVLCIATCHHMQKEEIIVLQQKK